LINKKAKDMISKIKQKEIGNSALICNSGIV